MHSFRDSNIQEGKEETTKLGIDAENDSSPNKRIPNYLKVTETFKRKTGSPHAQTPSEFEGKTKGAVITPKSNLLFKGRTLSLTRKEAGIISHNYNLFRFLQHLV